MRQPKLRGRVTAWPVSSGGRGTSRIDEEEHELDGEHGSEAVRFPSEPAQVNATVQRQPPWKGSLKSGYLLRFETMRGRLARDSLIKARKAKSIAQTRDEEMEQLRSTCTRLKFGDMTTPPTQIVPRSRSASPKGSTSPAKPATSSGESIKERGGDDQCAFMAKDRSIAHLERKAVVKCPCRLWRPLPNPLDASVKSLSDSGGSRFAGVGSKLVKSMDKMIKSVGDQASEVALEVQQLIADQSGQEK